MWDQAENELLKPCPFCGGEAMQEEDSGLESMITCTVCNVVIYRSKNDALEYAEACRKAWNRRV